MIKERKEMHHNSDEHLRLAELLKVSRSRQMTNRVEQIVVSNISIQEKIKKIEGLDSNEDADFESIQRNRLENQDEFLRQRNLIPQSAAKKNRQSAKKGYKRKGVFNFLFKEYSKIKRFGKRTNILWCTILPPRIVINKEIPKYFEKYLQNNADQMSQLLTKVLEIAWMHIGKEDYNLLYYFSKLCDAINSVNFYLLNYYDQNIIDRLKSLELYFIACCYNKKYPEIIQSNLSLIIKKHPEWKLKSAEAAMSVQRILLKGSLKPSLYNLIVGLNIMKHRTFLDFRSLTVADNLSLINTFDYECDSNTREKIDDYINIKKDDLKRLLKEKEQIDKLKKFIPLTEEKDFDLKILKHFYEKTDPQRGRDFANDIKNIMQYIQYLFESYSQIFSVVLNDEIEVHETGKVKIFSNSFFQVETSKIHFLLEKLVKYKYMFNSFPYARYLELRLTKKSGTATEVEVMQIISDFIAISMAVANKLMDVVRYHDPSIVLDEDENYRPIEKSLLLGKKALIPYWNVKIQEPLYFNSQNVIKALYDIITISLLIGVSLHDDKLTSLISKGDNIEKEINTAKENLERVANAVVFHEIQNELKLLL